MDWRDQGLLLSTRRHGESAAIIEVMTSAHGRHAGIVRGGASSKMTPVLQPGAQLDLEWRARLSDHLGAYRVEPLRSRAGALIGDRRRLAAFNAVAALILAFVPEREPNPVLYDLTLGLVDALAGEGEGWPAHYAVWELGLLGALGFRLDLSSCAATGATQDLIWVSPKSGRAVSRRGGEGWEERLLPLPGFLRGADPTPGDVAVALRLTGHFLTHWLLPAHGRPHLPEARVRLVALLSGDGVSLA